MAKIKIFSDPYKPKYATLGSAGLDLYVVNIDILHGGENLDEYKEEAVIQPGGRCMVRTGTKVVLPHGYSGSIRLRSSLGKEGWIIPNAPGTIDSDYRGEICILLTNTSNHAMVLTRGLRVAQLVPEYTPQLEIEYVGYHDYHNESNSTIRGGGGFGSTGK